MPSLHAVTFNISGWQLLEVKKFQKTWMNHEHKEVLSLNLFQQRPDFVANLSDIDALRHQSQRAIQPYDGEITEITNDILDGVPVLRQIIKVPMHKEGHGRIYIGSYTIPFQQYSYVIKVQSPEGGVTGLRESLAISELMRDGKMSLNEKLKEGETSRIPSDMQKLISQTTDNPKYDTIFPDHPLTRVREHLATLKETTRLDTSLHHAVPFSI